MRICGLLTRRHHQSSPSRAGGLSPPIQLLTVPILTVPGPRSGVTGTNVGKIGAVVDPTPMVQTIAAARGEIGLRHSEYCKPGIRT
jgi:hypothetical protein